MQPTAAHSHVFISYSHDSRQHEDDVLELSDRLRLAGVDACIDQYEDDPPAGWHVWMQKQIESAGFVLLVCTDNYRRRVEKKESLGKGLGAIWEGQIIYSHLYSGGGKNTKFI